MKRFVLPLVLAAVIAGLLLVIGYLLAGKRLGLSLPQIVTEQSDISAHTVVKEVLPIGEYASLAYRYTSVVKDINTKDIRGWNIPFTTRKYIFTYDGIMKLGFDGNKIRVEEGEAEAAAETGTAETGNESEAETGPASGASGTGKAVLRVILPPIRILSHEIDDDSIEVFEQSQTIFNEIKIADAFKVTAGRKREMEQKVMAGDAVDQARASAEQQFGALLGNLPGIRERYDIVFVWDAGEEAAAPLEDSL